MLPRFAFVTNLIWYGFVVASDLSKRINPCKG